MKFIKGVVASLLFLAPACYSPNKASYGHILESDYKDPNAATLNKKKELLQDIDFKAYLEEIEAYIHRINTGLEEFKSEEFKAKMEPYNTYLEVMSSELFSIERVEVNNDPELFYDDVVGVTFTMPRTMYLKDKELSLWVYTHEFGHLTDLKEDYICNLPRWNAIDLCPEFSINKLRAEMVADSFMFYIAHTLKTHDPFLARIMARSATRWYKSIDKSKTVEDLLSTLSDDAPASYYTAEGRIIAVLYIYKFKNAKDTWNFVRTHTRKEILKELGQIVKKHGDLGSLIEESLDTIDLDFWW